MSLPSFTIWSMIKLFVIYTIAVNEIYINYLDENEYIIYFDWKSKSFTEIVKQNSYESITGKSFKIVPS